MWWSLLENEDKKWFKERLVEDEDIIAIPCKLVKSW